MGRVCDFLRWSRMDMLTHTHRCLRRFLLSPGPWLSVTIALPSDPHPILRLVITRPILATTRTRLAITFIDCHRARPASLSRAASLPRHAPRTRRNAPRHRRLFRCLSRGIRAARNDRGWDGDGALLCGRTQGSPVCDGSRNCWRRGRRGVERQVKRLGSCKSSKKTRGRRKEKAGTCDLV